MPEATLEQVLERLRCDVLSYGDYGLLAAALVKREAVASGSGSVAVAGDVSNSSVVTINIEGGDPIAVSAAVLDKLGDAVRQRLPSVLHNLPPIAVAFAGRSAEEEAIVASLARERGAAAISALGGIGGVGKTALAVKIGHRLTALFPAAQLLVDLRGTSETPASPRAAMESVIRRFHPEVKLPDDDAAIGEIYCDLLQKNKCLLILDNARDAAQVAPLLPPPPSAAIVTSRPVLPLAGVAATRLDDLPLPEARKLVSDLIGGERMLSEDGLTQLAQACLRHPLSLRVAALFLKTHKGQSVAHYIARIEEDRTRLRLEGQPDHDVMAVLGLSVQQLAADNEALAGRWRLLSVFPADFGAAAAAAVWEIGSADDATDGLNTLEARGLVEAMSEDRYRLHDLLRDLARRDCPKEQAEAAALRHAWHFEQVLGTADRLLQTGGDALQQGLVLFDRERTNIMAGQRWAAERIDALTEARELAARCADTGAYVLSLRLHPRERIAWGEAALAAIRQIGDRRGEQAALGNLGVAHAALAEIRQAIGYFEQVLDIAREVRDRRSEGNALGNLGNAYAALGETQEAIEYLEQVLDIAREVGDRRSEAATLGNLGLAYDDLGDRNKAIECHEMNLSVAREIGDRQGEGASLNNLGLAYANLGETRQAIEYHEQALHIACETGDRRSEGNALGNLGNEHATLGETQEAIEYFERALNIAREVGDRRGEGASLNNLGNAYTNLGDCQKAFEHHERRLAIAREIGDHRGEGNALANMGQAAKGCDPERARAYWGQALTILTAIEDPNASRVASWIAHLSRGAG
jgi:tetratricopeptide (TPR) repeat protein